MERRRRLMMKKEEAGGQATSRTYNGYDWVDLGLPSSTLWARYNVGSTSNYNIGNYYYFGAGASAYPSGNTHTPDDSDFTNPISASHDTATQVMGGLWKMPTTAQIEELVSYTNRTLEYINSVFTVKLTSKINGEYIYVPTSGYYDQSGTLRPSDSLNYSFFWASDMTGAYGLNAFMSVSSSYSGYAIGTTQQLNCSSYSNFGNALPVRGVLPGEIMNPLEYVDLDLPSEKLWATKNVGADTPIDYGQYFQWGDTQGYTADQVGSGEGQKYFGWADYKYGNGASDPYSVEMTKYNSTDGKTVLDLSDDAARANMGGDWRMPTVDEFQELINNTNSTWATIGGISGRKFTSKINSSKYIFIPTAGNCSYGNRNDVGFGGHVQSASLNSSNVTYAQKLVFNSGGIDVYGGSRCIGYSVRGIMDNPNPHHLYYEINNERYSRYGSLTGDCTAQDITLTFYWDGLDGTISNVSASNITVTNPSNITSTSSDNTITFSFEANESVDAYTLPKYTIMFEYEGETVTFTYIQEADYIVDRTINMEINQIQNSEVRYGNNSDYFVLGMPYSNNSPLTQRLEQLYNMSSANYPYKHTYEMRSPFYFKLDGSFISSSVDTYKSGRISTSIISTVGTIYLVPEASWNILVPRYNYSTRNYDSSPNEVGIYGGGGIATMSIFYDNGKLALDGILMQGYGFNTIKKLSNNTWFDFSDTTNPTYFIDNSSLQTSNTNIFKGCQLHDYYNNIISFPSITILFRIYSNASFDVIYKIDSNAGNGYHIDTGVSSVTNHTYN